METSKFKLNNSYTINTYSYTFSAGGFHELSEQNNCRLRLSERVLNSNVRELAMYPCITRYFIKKRKKIQ